MKNGERTIERRKWVAAVMSMAMPGLGQVYNGELFKGMSFFIILVFIQLAGFRLSVYLKDGVLLAGVVVTLVTSLAVYALVVIEAYQRARRTGKDYVLKSFNTWYVYTTVWMLGTLLIVSTENYTKSNTIQAFKIPSLSMEPDVLQGDRIFVDKTAYRRMSPQKGDIVVFVYPDDRSKMYIKRIVGLPGEIVNLEGQDKKVPHGTFYVLGDNIQQSRDTRHFGFVPLRDIIGKTRLVYYSSGPDGIRWNRIGKTFGKSPD